MLSKVKNFREIFLLLGIALMALLYWLASPSMGNAVLHRDESVKAVPMPVSLPMTQGEPFVVELDVSSGFGGDFTLEIHPDDCVTRLKVNGIDLPFETYPGYCSWNNGFKLPKSEIQKHVGKDVDKFHFEMGLRNNSGLGGLTASISANSFLMGLFAVLLFLCIGGLIFSVGTRFKIDARLLLIFILGLILRVAYAQNTFFDERGHDTGGHLNYIQIVADNHHIPAADECWTCYHPPVYYIASAGVWNAFGWLGFSPQNAVKWFDFLISLVALGFGLACIRENLWGMSRYIAALLWCAWPSFILASPRIGNDILFYAMHAVVLWSCIRYIKTSLGKYLLVAVVAAAIAYWTKSTAVVSFGLVGVTVLAHTLPRFLRKLSRMEWASLAVLLVVGIVVLVRVLGGDIVANASGNDNSVLVQNNPGNFLFFDIRMFLTNPYIDPWHDELGRQFFWNYLAKTSLFGEFTLLNNDLGRWCATFASAGFLVLLGFGLRGFWKMRWTKVNVLLAAQALFFFAAMIALRLKYPYSCSNDFRYIVPVLLSCLPWVGEGIAGEESSIKLKVCGIAAVVVFVVSASVVVLKA